MTHSELLELADALDSVFPIDSNERTEELRQVEAVERSLRAEGIEIELGGQND